MCLSDIPLYYKCYTIHNIYFYHLCCYAYVETEKYVLLHFLSTIFRSIRNVTLSAIRIQSRRKLYSQSDFVYLSIERNLFSLFVEVS